MGVLNEKRCKEVLFITKTGSGEEVLRTSFSFCWFCCTEPCITICSFK